MKNDAEKQGTSFDLGEKLSQKTRYQKRGTRNFIPQQIESFSIDLKKKRKHHLLEDDCQRKHVKKLV